MRILKTQRSRGGGGGGGRRNSKKLGNGRTTHVSSRAMILRNCCGDGGEKFSEKLQALKTLLPPSTMTEKTTEQNVHVEEESDSEETEQLFQETADYIVRLRNQVLVLQKLIKIYGSSTEDFVL